MTNNKLDGGVCVVFSLQVSATFLSQCFDSNFSKYLKIVFSNQTSRIRNSYIYYYIVAGFYC